MNEFCSPTKKMSLKNFHIVGMIADGSYSEVYEAIHLKNNRKVAIKKIYKETITQHFKHIEVYVERYIMKTFSLKHPGIVQFVGSFQDKEFLYFVTEFCPYGDLGLIILELHQAYQKLQDTNIDFLIRAYIYQIASVIEFLHQEGVVHLDIKPKNIVVDQNYNLKLIDFATCHFFDASKQPEELGEQLKKHGIRQTIKKRKPSYETESDLYNSPFKSQFVGTPEYVSPEMLNQSYASKEADHWALGCIIYEFYYGHQPFTALSENAIFNNILQLKYTFNNKYGVPKDAQDIIAKLLVINPKDRLSIPLKHPYFNVIQEQNYIPWQTELPIPKSCKPLFQELMAKQSMSSIMWGIQPQQKQKQVPISRRSRLRTIIEELDDTQSPFLPQRTLVSNRMLDIKAQNTDDSEEQRRACEKSVGFVQLDQKRWFCIPHIALLVGYLQPPSLILDLMKGEKKYLYMDPSVQIQKEGDYYILQSSQFHYRFKDLEARPINWVQVVGTIKKEYIKQIFN